MDSDEDVCPHCKQQIPKRVVVSGLLGRIATSPELIEAIGAMLAVSNPPIVPVYDGPPPYAKIKKVAPYGKKAKRGGYRGY